MDTKSHYFKALSNVIRASRHIEVRSFAQATQHIKKAKFHAEKHTDELRSTGKHEEAGKFSNDFNKFFKELDGFHQNRAKAPKKPFFKSEAGAEKTHSKIS